MRPGDRNVPREDIERAETDRERDVDVLAVHRQAIRETGDPVEGRERGPWWYWAAAVGTLLFGGFYFGRYTGVFAGAPAVHAPVGPRAMMAARAPRGAVAAPARSGATVYAATCQACHLANGDGTPGLFPPLAGSEYVTGDAARLIRIVLKGLTGPVTVRGTTITGQMPPWQQLADAELAAVLTYVRSQWGNAAGAIAAEDVARERAATQDRARPWTVGELGP